MLNVVVPFPSPHTPKPSALYLANSAAYVVRLISRPLAMSQRVAPSGSTGSVDSEWSISEPSGGPAVAGPGNPPDTTNQLVPSAMHRRYWRSEERRGGKEGRNP